MSYFSIKTPLAQKIKLKDGTITEVIFNKNLESRLMRNFEKAQEYIDSEVIRLSDPYTPFKTGALRKSGVIGTKIGSGDVIYASPYGRYQYYGKVMVGKPPKRVTDKPLTYHGGGKVGAFWFEVMKKRYKNQILDGAKKIINE